MRKLMNIVEEREHINEAVTVLCDNYLYDRISRESFLEEIEKLGMTEKVVNPYTDEECAIIEDNANKLEALVEQRFKGEIELAYFLSEMNRLDEIDNAIRRK